MPRVAFVDGRYLPHGQAAIHVEDRGYQFADGVYEVVAVIDGRRVDEARHLDRLERSLGELAIPVPMSRRALSQVMGHVVRRNRVVTGLIYLQVTRGVAPRDHAGPRVVKPVLTVTARPQRPPADELVRQGVRVVTTPDIRWKRNDIKSISLLPNILGKQKAREQGAYEAWLVDADGSITEGTSSTAWIVDADGRLVTRPLDDAILGGVTRAAVIDLAAAAGIAVDERPFSRAQALAASEAFLTSASCYILPVTTLDGAAIGDGRPGAMTLDLLARYRRHILEFKTS